MSLGKRFSELLEKNPTTLDYIVGTRHNLDGTFTDFRYKANDLVSTTKKRITVVDATDADSVGLLDGILRDDFFALNEITEIVAGGQTYMSEDDFTQSGNAITPIAFGLSSGQKIIAKI